MALSSAFVVALKLADVTTLPTKRPLIVSFFQEDCSACRRQIEELPCFREKGWEVLTIGVGENRLRLKQEIQPKKGEPLPFQQMSWSTARDIGINATPYSLIFEQGDKRSGTLGVIACKAKD